VTGDVDGMIADALVEPRDKAELHADLQIDTTRRVALEDRLTRAACCMLWVTMTIV
jgi:hypothetical protein